MKRYWRKSDLAKINITNTKIYEVSDWFRNIIQRLKKTKRRIFLQNKWFDLAHKYMLQNNLCVLNSTFDAFSIMRNKVYRKNLWRYFSISMVYQDRMKKIQKYAKHLQNYIIQKKRKKWANLSSRLYLAEKEKDFREAFSSYLLALNNWISFFNRIVRQSKLKDFNLAHKELQKQKQLQLSISNEQKSSSLRASYRNDWISLARRFSRQNRFLDMMELSNCKIDSDNDESNNIQKPVPTVNLSSTQTQTKLPNTESIPYKNFLKMLRNYYIQRFYANLDEIHDKFREKQRQKKIQRQQEARRNWRYFIRNYKKLCRTDELEFSYQQLQRFRNRWKRFYQRLYLNNLQLLCENGLTFLDTKYLLVSQKWKAMIVRTLLDHKKTIVEDHLQKYREKQLQKAINYGTNFLFNSEQDLQTNVPGIKNFVKSQYDFKMLHYEKTIPTNFWHDASYFAFSFTHKSLYDAANLAIPLLTEHATPLAEAFADCQGILTASDQSNRIKLPLETRKKEINKSQNKQKDIHIIVGFNYNDQVSLLEYVGE